MNKKLSSLLEQVAPSAIAKPKDSTLKIYSVEDADSLISKNAKKDAGHLKLVNDRRETMNHLDEYLQKRAVKELFKAFYPDEKSQLSAMSQILKDSYQHHISIDECFFTSLFLQVLEDIKFAQPLVDKFTNKVLLKDINMATARICLFEAKGALYSFTYYNLTEEDYHNILSDNTVIVGIAKTIANTDLQSEIARYMDLSAKEIHFNPAFLDEGRYFGAIAALVHEIDQIEITA